MNHFKSSATVATAVAMASTVLAGCQGAPAPAPSPPPGLTGSYAVAALPEAAAVRLIDGVRSGTTTIASLMTQTATFPLVCQVNPAVNRPELSILPSARPGDRNFVVRVIGGTPTPVNGTITSGCAPIGDFWFYIGGGSAPAPLAPLEPLNIGVRNRDIAGRVVLAQFPYPSNGGGTNIGHDVDFSEPESGSALLSEFAPGPPRQAAGEYSFIDSAPLRESKTAVIIGEFRFNLTRP